MIASILKPFYQVYGKMLNYRKIKCLLTKVDISPKKHETLLARGPNFAVVPRCPPKEAYISAVESVHVAPPQRQKN